MATVSSNQTFDRGGQRFTPVNTTPSTINQDDALLSELERLLIQDTAGNSSNPTALTSMANTATPALGAGGPLFGGTTGAAPVFSTGFAPMGTGGFNVMGNAMGGQAAPNFFGFGGGAFGVGSPALGGFGLGTGLGTGGLFNTTGAGMYGNMFGFSFPGVSTASTLGSVPMFTTLDSGSSFDAGGFASNDFDTVDDTPVSFASRPEPRRVSRPVVEDDEPVFEPVPVRRTPVRTAAPKEDTMPVSNPSIKGNNLMPTVPPKAEPTETADTPKNLANPVGTGLPPAATPVTPAVGGTKTTDTKTPETKTPEAKPPAETPKADAGKPPSAEPPKPAAAPPEAPKAQPGADVKK